MTFSSSFKVFQFIYRISYTLNLTFFIVSYIISLIFNEWVGYSPTGTLFNFSQCKNFEKNLIKNKLHLYKIKDLYRNK